MSELFNQAKVIMEKAWKDFEDVGRKMAVDEKEDSNARNLVYYAMADLSVTASEVLYLDSPEVHTGPVEADNAQSMVVIDGIEIRGDVQFEILNDGQWITGHRENSQYGQVMAGKGIILFNQIQGRVRLPLKHDR